jgi:hypothetical protein
MDGLTTLLIAGAVLVLACAVFLVIWRQGRRQRP